ncbi:MAG: hypothetical protein LBG05_05235, partial [Treponema sp.]|nr:hypothetical protein [Treponema sp.]
CQTLLGAAFVGAMSLWKKSADYADFLSAFICAICGPLFPSLCGAVSDTKTPPLKLPDGAEQAAFVMCSNFCYYKCRL